MESLDESQWRQSVKNIEGAKRPGWGRGIGDPLPLQVNTPLKVFSQNNASWYTLGMKMCSSMLHGQQHQHHIIKLGDQSLSLSLTYL